MHRSRFGFSLVMCAGTLVGLPLHALGQGGWTNLTPPAGAQVFYVAANGSDSNPGTQSAPFRSLGRGYNALRANQPDQLLLRCGDTWNEPLEIRKGSGSGSTYMVFGSYGSGPRPKVAAGGGPVIGIYDVRGVAIADLDITGSTIESGIWIPGGSSDILVEGCSIIGLPGGVNSHGQTGGNIQRLKIRRNVFADSTSPNPQGGQLVFLGEQFNALIEENVFDRAGRTGEQTIFKHSLYIHDNNAGPATVIGNIHARSCADSVQQRPGGVCTNNLSIQNPIGHTWGGNGVFSYNVAIDARDINPNDPRGIAFSLSGSGNVEYNIAAYQVTASENITAFNMSGYDSGTVRGNCVYDWKAPGGQGWATALQWDGGGGTVNVTGNKFFMPNIGMLARHESRGLSSEFHYSNNSYYTSTPSGGVGGFQQFSVASGVGRDWNGWRNAAGETGSTFLGSAPANPNATIGAYLQSIGVSPGSDPVNTFMMEARKQSKQNWRTQFTAAAFNDWARARMGLPLYGGGNPPPPNCYANCDASPSSPVLTGNDFACFLNKYAQGQSSADCDGVGGLNANDFVCFVNAYANGCS